MAFHWPNTTGKGTALLRALFQRDPDALIRDEYADWYLDPGQLQDLENKRFADIIPAGPPGDFTRIACWYGALREKYFDEVVEASIRSGCRRLLLLGAGFDTRFFRLPLLHRTEIKTVEVDREETIREKKEVIGRHLAKIPENLELVGMDLSSDGLSTLFESGPCKHELTVCICQGLSYYLTQDDFAALLESLRRCLPSGSIVGFDCCTPLMLYENTEIPGIGYNIQRLKEINDPYRFGMWVDDIRSWIAAKRFEALEIVTQSELAIRYHLEVSLPENMWYVVLTKC